MDLLLKYLLLTQEKENSFESIAYDSIMKNYIQHMSISILFAGNHPIVEINN